MLCPWSHGSTNPATPHFGLGQNSVTIKRVGHGWVCTYHFETHTIKVFRSLWDKHTIMPLMRIRVAVCFDGRIVIHDHIPTNTLRALSPLPHFLYTVCFVPILVLFYSQSVNPFTSISSSLFNFSPGKRTPCFHPYYNSTCIFTFPFPLSPSPLRSEYLKLN